MHEFIGQIIDDRFEVLHKIGEGGMATVYLCHDRENNKKVALKVVTVQSADGGFSRRRFKREFMLTKRVDHPNVISLHHFGAIDDNTFYTAMDYIKGKDLMTHLDDEGYLPEEEIQSIALKLARALAALHAEDVIHRDLKPANIMIVDGKEPIIMDFGLARALDMTRMTETGTILGTPLYMAPEQTQGKATDHRADIYQFGAIVFEMLTGQPPFTGKTIAELLTNIMERRAPLVSSRAPSLSLRWDHIVERCLQKDPELRYENAQGLIKDLEKVLDPIEEELLPTRKQSVDDKEGHSPRGAKTKKRTKANRLFPALAIALLLGVFIIAFSLLMPKKQAKSFSHNNLQVESSLTTLTLRWQSTEPYPTVIQIINPISMKVRDGNKPTRNHVVHLEGLQENTSYGYKIIYPKNRSSLLKKAKTKTFKVKIQKAVEMKKGLTVIWQVSPPAEEISLKTTPSVVSAKVSHTATGLIQSTLTGPYWQLEELGLVATYGKTTVRSCSLKTVLFEDLQKVVSTMQTQDRKEFLEELAQTSANSPAVFVNRLTNSSNEAVARERKLQQLNKLIARWKTRHKRLFTHWTRACELSPLILGTRILPLQSSQLFDRSLNTMMALHAFYTYECGFAPFTFPQRGHFAFHREPLGEPDKKIVLLQREKDSLLYLGIHLVIGREAERRWQKVIDINNVERFDRAELSFAFNGFDNACMSIFINSLKMQLLGHRKIAPNGRIPYQRVPIDALREGKNTISFKFEALASSHMDAQIELLACTLHLYEKVR